MLAIAAAAAPARAVDVVGTSARLRWTPASGPVAAYAVWVIHQGSPPPSSPSLATLTNEVTVQGAIGDTFQVQVAALDARGVLGPHSPLSAVIRFVPTPSSSPHLVLSTSSVSLTAQQGGAAAPARVGIGTGGGGSLAWTARSSARWLVLGPALRGSAPANLEIGARAFGLAPGRYQATVTVTPAGGGGSPQKVQVALTVQPRTFTWRRSPRGSSTGSSSTPSSRTFSAPSSGTFSVPSSTSLPELRVSTLGLSVSATAGEAPPAASFTVRNAGSGTLRYRITSRTSWLAVSPSSGTSQGEADTIRVSVASAGLGAGTYRGTLLLTAPGVGSSSIDVTLVVSGTRAVAHARPYDLDGDGHADVLTRDASGAYRVTLLGSQGPIAHSALGATPPAGATLVGSGDLDADGKADLVWNDPGSGGLQLWLMHGASPAATRALPLGGRTLLAIADFDGDGRSDLLLDAGGSAELWHMNGLNVGSITSGISGLASARVISAADLDGDGLADLLVAMGTASRTTYGALGLVGTRFVSLLALPIAAPSLSFVTAGPCASSGTPGILWRDSSDGGLVLWTLGRSVTTHGTLGVVIPPEWQLAATGDFSGDGRTDLLVRQGTTGALVVLAFDGTSLVGGFQVESALPPGIVILNR